MKILAVLFTSMLLVVACGGGADLSATTNTNTVAKANATFATPPQPGH